MPWGICKKNNNTDFNSQLKILQRSLALMFRLGSTPILIPPICFLRSDTCCAGFQPLLKHSHGPNLSFLVLALRTKASPSSSIHIPPSLVSLPPRPRSSPTDGGPDLQPSHESPSPPPPLLISSRAPQPPVRLSPRGVHWGGHWEGWAVAGRQGECCPWTHKSGHRLNRPGQLGWAISRVKRKALLQRSKCRQQVAQAPKGLERKVPGALRAGTAASPLPTDRQ